MGVGVVLDICVVLLDRLFFLFFDWEQHIPCSLSRAVTSPLPLIAHLFFMVSFFFCIELLMAKVKLSVRTF